MNLDPILELKVINHSNELLFTFLSINLHLSFLKLVINWIYLKVDVIDKVLLRVVLGNITTKGPFSSNSAFLISSLLYFFFWRALILSNTVSMLRNLVTVSMLRKTPSFSDFTATR